jgi:hypothetical protein
MLLQRRDNVSSIEQPGKIGLFGGHRKCGETFLECVVRKTDARSCAARGSGTLDRHGKQHFGGG